MNKMKMTKGLSLLSDDHLNLTAPSDGYKGKSVWAKGQRKQKIVCFYSFDFFFAAGFFAAGFFASAVFFATGFADFFSGGFFAVVFLAGFSGVRFSASS